MRYFNTAGAHKSGQVGEAPKGVPTCLMPFCAQVAAGKRKEVCVYGDDHDTPDGTGTIHIPVVCTVLFIYVTS